MNLQKLFQIQKQLDDRIVKEHGLEGKDLLDEKFLALKVEIGELANEQRSWKFWSKDQEPRYKKDCIFCKGIGFISYGTGAVLSKEEEPCDECYGKGYTNPLLEEYVDGIHFFLSLANDLEINPIDFVVEGDYTKETTTETFNEVFSLVSSIPVLMDVDVPATITMKDIQEVLHEAFSCYVGLAEKFLGFTWEQIEQAYLDKNKINHTRQDDGY